MTIKSWSIWVAGVVILALVSALGLKFLSPELTKANFERLRLGMTEQEVEAIMGIPTEDEDVATLSPLPNLGPEGMAEFKNWQASIARLKKWHTGRYVFSGDFDKDGRLTRTAYFDWNKVGGW